MDHLEEKEKKITKGALLKQIKQLDRYKKEYFSYTIIKLQEVLKEIQTERVLIKEPIFEDEPVYEEPEKPIKPYKQKQEKSQEVKAKESVKEDKKKFNKEIIQPIEEEYEDTEEEQIPYEEPVKQAKIKFEKQIVTEEKPKPIKKKILKNVKDVIKLEEKEKPKIKLNRVLFKDENYKKEIQKLLRDLKTDIDELLNDFDNEDHLSDEDSDVIKNEYNSILEKAYDNIENILEQYPTDLNYHKIIERKIKLVDEKVQKFLIND